MTHKINISNLTEKSISQRGLVAPSDFINNLLSNFTIEDLFKIPIIKKALKKVIKTPRGIVCICPFHNEKTPSFHINHNSLYSGPGYRCYGCGAGGDLLKLLQGILTVYGIKENKSKAHYYFEAVKMFAKAQGMQLKYGEIYKENYWKQLESEENKKNELINIRHSLLHSIIKVIENGEYATTHTTEISKFVYSNYQNQLANEDYIRQVEEQIGYYKKIIAFIYEKQEEKFSELYDSTSDDDEFEYDTISSVMYSNHQNQLRNEDYIKELEQQIGDYSFYENQEKKFSELYDSSSDDGFEYDTITSQCFLRY